MALPKKKSASFLTVRLAILGACLGWFAQKRLKTYFFPYGLPRKQEWNDRPICAPIDKTNEKLMLKSGKLQKIYERVEDGKKPLLKSPETVFFDESGVMYFGTGDGNLVSMTDLETMADGKVTGKTKLVADLGPGRPLGGKFSGETLYIADAALGLTRIQNISDPMSKVEIVASTVKDNGNLTRLYFVDDVVIGPKSGAVYFTDASMVRPERDIDSSTYDAMYASKIDSLLGPSGRLLKYDPSTDELTILAKDIWFANGIAVDADEEYLVVAETFRLGLIKYYLAGDKKGTSEYITKGAPSTGYFDGVDCAIKGKTGESSLCYAVNPSSCVPAHKILWKLPHPIDLFFKSLIMMLPPSVTPKTKSYGGIVVIDPETSTFVELLQDPEGKDIGHLTGVTVHNNQLYLGSLENDFIGVYDLAP